MGTTLRNLRSIWQALRAALKRGFGGGMARGAALALLLMVFPVGVHAHNSSQGYNQFTLDGRTVDARVWLIAADWHHLLSLDPNEDGLLTQEEVQPSSDAVAAFLTQTLRVEATDEAQRTLRCQGRFVELDTLEPRGLPPAFGAHLMFECPAQPLQLRIRFGVFTGSPVAHVNVGVLKAGGRTEELVFTPQTRELNVVIGEARSAADVAREFFLLGGEHIITGYDHLLFLLALLLVTLRFRDVVLVVTAFTVAHSVTLGLAALQVASIAPSIVEPAIAASIVYVAVENGWVLARNAVPRLPRPSLAFAFGLVHGFGFAGALQTAGLPRGSLLLGLAMFNVGVEAGQLLFCLVAFGALWLVRRTRFARQVALGLSGAAALLGAYWCVERLLG